MPGEDDLKKYQHDQDLFFQELEEKQRRSEQLITAHQVADLFERAGIDLEPFFKLKRQLAKLGSLAGMSKVDAEDWANGLVQEGMRLRLQSTQ